jgi:hypothetical protein
MTNRRSFSRRIAGAAIALFAGAQESMAQSHTAAAGKTLRMKITGVEPIMTGSDVFLKITTDAGITGYGTAHSIFFPTETGARWHPPGGADSVAGSWNLLT